jgi:prevent-host-death family protein
MPIAIDPKNNGIVISATRARATFARLLRRVHAVHCPLLISRRGVSVAVLLSIHDYVKLAAPEPKVLKAIGEEALKNKTTALTSRQIDRIIEATRATGRA